MPMLFRVPILWRLAFRNLLRQPQRSFATALGIALGVASVLATLSLGGAIQRGIRKSLQSVTGQADHLIVASGAARALFSLDNLPLDGIDALPVLEQPVRFGDEGFSLQGLGNTDGLLLSGRLLADARSRPQPLVAGTWASVGSNGIVVTEDVQQRWQLALGDTVRLSTMLGERDFVLSGVMEGGSSSLLLAQLEDVQQQLRLTNKASYVAVYGSPPQNLPAEVILTKPSANGAYAVDGLIELLANGLRLLACLLLLLSGLLAYNTFAVARLERQRELSLLRILCLTAKQVARLAWLEALIIGILGGILGLVLSLAFSWLLLYGYGLVLDLPLLGGFQFSWHYLLSLPISLSIALLAAGWQRQDSSPLASRQRQEKELTPQSAWLRYALGFGLLALGIAAIFSNLPSGALQQILFAIAASVSLMLALPLLAPLIIQGMLWLSRPLRRYHHLLRLSYDFSSRSQGRNAVALSTVALGISLILMVGSLVAGFDRTIIRWVSATVSGDIFLNIPLGVPEGFADEALQNIAGLEQLSPVGFATVRAENLGTRGRNLALILAEPQRFDPQDGFGTFWYTSESTQAHEGFTKGQVIVSSTLAQRFGLAIGDSLRLRTTAGTRDLKIAGSIVDFTAGGESIVMSYDFASQLGITSPRIFVGIIDANADAEVVSQALKEHFPDVSMQINNGQYYRRRVLTMSRRIFGATYSLLLLAILLSALAVSNTLAMNLKRRQHDLASLRVLGISKEALRRLVIIESLWIVLPAGVIGLFYGWLLSILVGKSVAALSEFTIMVTLPWWLLLLALLLSPLVALLAALAPARVARRLEPVVALRQAEL